MDSKLDFTSAQDQRSRRNWADLVLNGIVSAIQAHLLDKEQDHGSRVGQTEHGGNLLLLARFTAAIWGAHMDNLLRLACLRLYLTGAGQTKRRPCQPGLQGAS